jgi:hypothetical protein
MANHSLQQLRRAAQQIEAALHHAGALTDGIRRQAAQARRG